MTFYDWYLSAIREKGYSEYKPRFVKTKNGMTTLDFSNYFKCLKDHGFTDLLISIEKKQH